MPDRTEHAYIKTAWAELNSTISRPFPKPEKRWTAAAMQEAAKGFRRLKTHKQLPALRAALEAHQTKSSTHGGVRTIEFNHGPIDDPRAAPSFKTSFEDF